MFDFSISETFGIIHRFIIGRDYERIVLHLIMKGIVVKSLPFQN